MKDLLLFMSVTVTYKLPTMLLTLLALHNATAFMPYAI